MSPPPPGPSHQRGRSRDHPGQALPSHPESPGLAGRSSGDSWDPVPRGRTCRPGLSPVCVCVWETVMSGSGPPPSQAASGRRGWEGGRRCRDARPAALTALWLPPRTWPRSSAPSSGRRRRPWSRRRRIPRPQSAPRARRLRRGSRAVSRVGPRTCMAASGPPRIQPHREPRPGPGAALRPP